jgi:hypothetical protein
MSRKILGRKWERKKRDKGRRAETIYVPSKLRMFDTAPGSSSFFSATTSARTCTRSYFPRCSSGNGVRMLCVVKESPAGAVTGKKVGERSKPTY